MLDIMNLRCVVHLPDRPLDVGDEQSASPSWGRRWSDPGLGLLNQRQHPSHGDRLRVHAVADDAQLSKT